MENNISAKNYMNDIYLMVPLADNQKNWRMEELGILNHARQEAKEDYINVENAFTRK